MALELATCIACNAARVEYHRLAEEYDTLLETSHSDDMEKRALVLRQANAKGTDMLTAFARYSEALGRFTQFVITAPR